MRRPGLSEQFLGVLCGFPPGYAATGLAVADCNSIGRSLPPMKVRSLGAEIGARQFASGTLSYAQQPSYLMVRHALADEDVIAPRLAIHADLTRLARTLTTSG
jgi:hypothetical protein